MLLQFDGTFFVILISFLVFAVIMQNIFYLPMRTVIENRDEHISDNYDEAKRSTETANKLLQEYYEKIRQARLASQRTIDQITNKGKEEGLKIVSQTSTVVKEEAKTAKEELEKEKDLAIGGLMNEVAPLAQIIVSKVLGTTVAISGINHDKVNKLMRG